MKTLWRIFAIARTEFRFGLRRSAPVVMTILIGIIVGVGILLEPISALQDWAPLLGDWPPEKIERLSAAGYTMEEYKKLIDNFIADWSSVNGATLGWGLMSMTLLFLPIATISAIPADRKFDVMEILRSTPITGGIYLAGKILGVMAVVFLSGLIPFLLFLAVLEGILFSFLHVNISANVLMFYIALSLMDGLPLLAYGSAIGVLTGVVFRTRRAAIFPGFLVGILCIFLWSLAFKPPTFQPDVAANYVFQNFHSEALAEMLKITGLEPFGLLGQGAATAEIGQVLLMYAAILAALAIVATLARLWLHWKENF